MQEKSLGPESLGIVNTLWGLAEVKVEKGDLANARALLERALGILEGCQLSENPGIAHTLDKLADVLDRQGNMEEAGALRSRAGRLWSKDSDREHDKTVERSSAIKS